MTVGHSTYQVYRRTVPVHGLTEGFLAVLARDDALRKSGSVGVPPLFYTMRIVGDDGQDLPAGAIGEIVGPGPNSIPSLQSDDVP
jgi:long-chain acyl-CoA synthetase